MWQIIILSFLTIVVQGGEIEKFYGTWTQVAFYPISGNIPTCIEFALDKDARNIDCTCADGKNAKLLELSLLFKQGGKTPIDSFPILVANTPNEVSLGVECMCGDKHYDSRVVARSVNSNYIVMYEKKKNKDYTAAEPNDAAVFAKKVPNHADLKATLQSIEDLKNRKGAEMCASDLSV